MHGGRDRKKLDEVDVNLVTDNMAVNFDVFSSFLEHKIGSYLYGGLIITIKNGWLKE